MYGNSGRGGDREGGYGGGGGGYGGGYGGPSTAPVKVGDELEVTIEAVGEKGDGLAKKDGFVLFVPGVKQGDRVRIRVTRVLRKVGFAEVVGKAGEAAPAQAEKAEEADEEAGALEAEETEAEAPAVPAEDTESFGEEEGEQ